MTFLSGWRLVLLVAPAALLVAYVIVQRRRHRQVLRFTSVELLDSVAPKRSGWQRHVPAAATLVSLVLLTLAFAQPAMAMRTAKQRATILLTLDTSGSMSATDVAPSRLKAMTKQATTFVKHVPKGIQVGLVTFGGSARLLVPPSTDTAAVQNALDSLTVGGATATADGITTALTAIADVPKGTSGKPTPAVIVLMSDGSPTVGSDENPDPVAAADDAAVQAKQAVGVDRHHRLRHIGWCHRGAGPAGARPVRPRRHGAHCIGQRRTNIQRRDQRRARLDLRADRPRRRIRRRRHGN